MWKLLLFAGAILAAPAANTHAQQKGASEFASVPWIDRANRSEPVIVHNGWTNPDTIHLSRNVEELEKRPFTGVVTWVSWPRQENGRLWLKSQAGDPEQPRVYDQGRHILMHQRIPAEAIDGAIADLMATKFTRFKQNFLQTFFIVPPTALKPNFWFDDALWKTACENFAVTPR
jgi:hypothetical protein